MKIRLVFLLFFLSFYAVKAQNTLPVKGTITDEEGKPLAGVTVSLRNGSRASTTDSAGAFFISAAPAQTVLLVSYVGYVTQELTIAGNRNISVQLAEDFKSLEKVVVVGFGTQKKVNLTGSVATINGAALARQSTLQTSSALQGLAPGLTVTRAGGTPGSGATIRIRGIGTIGDASKLNPLVLVDGVESSIDGVNPNDIQNISVLKDAASSAIYGSRAAGGVILITTKRAGTKTEVNYSSAVSWQLPTALPDLVDGYNYMLLNNVAYTNEGKTPFFTPAMLQAYRDSTGINPDKFPNTDWYDALYHTALQHNHFISVNAGTEKARILASFGYMSQDGIMNNSGFDRFTFRLNTNLKAANNLDFNFDVSGRQSKYTSSSYDAASAARDVLFSPPIYAPKYSDGRLGASSNGRNPVAVVDKGGTTIEKIYNIQLNFNTIYRPIKNLTLTLNVAPTYSFSNQDAFVLPVSLYEYASTTVSFVRPTGINVSSLTSNNNSTFNLLLKGFATYNAKIKTNHNITALVGFEQIRNEVRGISGFRDNFPLVDYQVLNAGSSANQRATGNLTAWALRSFFGRINYDYKSKYLLEGNVRYDGSSRLAQGHQWDVFPSVSAGWRVSEEGFMSGVDLISNLKIRGSWGLMGNQNIGLYPFASTIDLGLFSILGNTRVDGASLTDLANKNIGWETTEMKNLGLELGLFKNKLSIEADYFIKDTRDILLSLPIPSTIGLNPPVQNAGKVRNTGYELNILYNDNISVFNYNLGFNFSYIKNRVMDLRGSGPYISGNNITQVGYPINSIYVYEAERLFQQSDNIASLPTQIGVYGAGDIKYADISGPNGKPDGKISSEDRKIFATTSFPKYSFAITLGAKYKDFDFNLFMQGVTGIDKLLSNQAAIAFYEFGTPQKWMLDYWTPENPNASYPRLTTTYTNNSQVSSFFLRDASYLRLKNIQLGYTFSNSVTGKTFVESCRIFVSGQDILTFSKFYKGWDPENGNATGIFYPFVSNYTVGINLRF